MAEKPTTELRDGGTDDVASPVVSTNWLVSVGTMRAVLVGGIVAAVWINTTLLQIGAKIDALTMRMDRAEFSSKRIDDIDERGTTAMRSWVELFRASNPTLTVPPATR